MNDFAYVLMPAYVLILLLYIPFILYYRRRIRSRWARRRFTRGVVSILENCQISNDCASQILTLFKALSERYEGLSERSRSAVEMLEDLLCYLDTSEPETFKNFMKVDPPTQYRSRIVEILHEIRKLQPFSSLSSREGNLLAMLKHAIDTSNTDLARNTLRQLSDEIEVLESNVRRQERRNRISFTISAIGAILTFFFGIISFIQFIVK